MPSSRLAAWRPTRFELLAIAGAFLLGMVLFLVATRGQRGDAPAVAPTAVANPSSFDPLPAPMAADAAGASGMVQPGEDAPLEEQPRLVEAPRPAPAPAAPPPPTVRAPVADVGAVPISSPPPTYPRRAMQRRQTGTVRVQDIANVTTSFPGFEALARSVGFGLREA